MTRQSAPGFATHPEHKVEIALHESEMHVRAAGREIARSTRVLRLVETDYPDRFYFPVEDVDMAALRESGHTSYCPFKGKARYWHVVAGDDCVAENAVWAYDEPYEECAGLVGHVAFWGDRLVVE